MTGGAEIPNYPEGNLPGFKFPDVIARFGANRYGLITNSGIFATQNITANPIIWTSVGTNAPTNACGLWAAGSVVNPTFFALTGSCSGFISTLVRHNGASTAGAWQNVPLPPGFSGVGVFAVDPKNANRLFASIFDNSGAHMMRSSNGGTTWTADTALDGLMTGGGTFRAQTAALPYVQPTMVAFDPNNSNNLLAGAADAGIFLSQNNGTSWRTLTNNSGDAANPIVPRPSWAYFDLECSQNNIYVGTQGRGAWHLSFPDAGGTTVSACQDRCESSLSDCRNECDKLRADCVAEAGQPGGRTIAQCNQDRTRCRTECSSARNVCRQRCVDCPQ